MRGGRKYMGNLLSSSQFCYKPDTAIKNKILKKPRSTVKKKKKKFSELLDNDNPQLQEVQKSKAG